MIKLLEQLYGSDILNTILKIVFEILLYTVSSLIGSLIREINIEKEAKASRVCLTVLASASILFVCGNLLKTYIKDVRLLFGVGVLMAMYLPKFTEAFKSGKILIFITKIFNKEVGASLEEVMNKKEDKFEEVNIKEFNKGGKNVNKKRN